MVGNNAMFAHHTGRGVFLSTNIHTNRHITTKFLTAKNQLSNTLCLVGSKGVHRVNNQCLNATLATVLVAVFQNRVEEALGFTGTCACCDQCRSTIISGQSFKGFLLMYIREVCRVDCVKASRHFVCHTEREAHSNIRLMIN